MYTVFSLNYLEKLMDELIEKLTIKHLGNESLQTIISRMEFTLKYFEDNKDYNHFIPFLQTYLFVTKGVCEKINKADGYFNNISGMEQLDVFFAKLYFDPLREYIVKGELSEPWKNYLTFCKDGYDSPFIQLLVGINVHINSDLVHSLYSLKYTEDEDFQKINEILLDIIPSLMSYLAFVEHDLVGFGGIFLRHFYRYEFKTIIVRWRNEAYENASKLRSGSMTLESIHEQTESISKIIIDSWGNHKTPLNALTFLKKLNSLSIK